MKHKNTFFRKNLTLNLRGNILDLGIPRIMGVLNITPDSFFAQSRVSQEYDLLQKAEQMLNEGASLIDIGAYSSRPNAYHTSEEEEIQRLLPALQNIRKAFPEAYLSVDTFRPEVARIAIDNGVDIINDIYGGGETELMFNLVAKTQTPYIMMHCRGTVQNRQEYTEYEHLISDIFAYFQQKLIRIQNLGLKDCIVDVGFGFAKTLDQNYTLLKHLDQFQLLHRPLLVGVSRKSMIFNLLKTDAENALNGTSIANTIALIKGANILRVHDVKEAVECVKICQKIM